MLFTAWWYMMMSPHLSCAAFRWLWRQRIRVHLEGTGINPTPVDLHEQQLSLEQHNQAHRITTMDIQQSKTASAMCCCPSLSVFLSVEMCRLGLD